MAITKKSFGFIFAAVAFCVVFAAAGFGAAAVSEGDLAADRLARGKKLYNEGKYDDAMDNFIDVFVHGHGEQIAEANEYVNLIHFAIGGVTPPKKAPYDPFAAMYGGYSDGGSMSDEEMEALRRAQAERDATEADAKAAASAASGVDADIDVEDTYPAGTPEEIRAIRAQRIDAQVNAMTQTLIERIKKENGVNVYMRGGYVDAIDIESDILFKDEKPTFNAAAKPLLDDIYALMILSGRPTFWLLPPGSYTDEVSIKGVKKVIALNSYFINMGLSSAKLHFNMGLTAEQPQPKFRDLEGISIVFDYTEQPDLKLKLADKNTPPVLSLGMYPFESITPESNEGMLIDFSVVEASAPVKDWRLQLVQHGSDGKYYVVRQVTGSDSAYRQIFWNGRKEYFGPVLPVGRYTAILIAHDVNGREKVVRRKIVLNPKEALRPDAVTLQQKEDANLNYSAHRLWTKPKRTAKTAPEEVVTESNEHQQYSQPAGGVYDPNANDPLFQNQPAGAYDNYPQYPNTNTGSLPSGYEPAGGGGDGGYNTVNMPYPSQQPADDYNY